MYNLNLKIFIMLTFTVMFSVKGDEKLTLINHFNQDHQDQLLINIAGVDVIYDKDAYDNSEKLLTEVGNHVSKSYSKIDLKFKIMCYSERVHVLYLRSLSDLQSPARQ